jgi:hypothetical protein
LSLLSFSERERFAEREGRPLGVEEEAPNEEEAPSDMAPRLEFSAITEGEHGEESWRGLDDFVEKRGQRRQRARCDRKSEALIPYQKIFRGDA